MPLVDHIGVSRRIKDEKERKRLREIVQSMKPPAGGFIVRTASEGAEADEIRTDMEFLLHLWSGGAPQELNDSQWRHMQVYYRDHPEVGGYLYVALRAPDNTWNGFYTGYVYPLIQNLLRQFILFGDVDPNKKFIMGYSHGGYGAFAIGLKMPDYFAAIHASAAAPADGAVPLTLRNTVFSCMLGSRDTMYGRYDRIREFEQAIRELRGNRTDIYPVTIQIIPDHPHAGLPDRDKIVDMYPAVRNAVPRELTWRLTDGVIRDFFRLHVPAPAAGQDIVANCTGNRLVIQTSTKLAGASIYHETVIDRK